MSAEGVGKATAPKRPFSASIALEVLATTVKFHGEALPPDVRGEGYNDSCHALAVLRQLADEVEEESAIRERMAELLAGAIVAIRGPETAGTRWGYHDLPARCAELAAERSRLADEVERLRAQRDALLAALRGAVEELEAFEAPASPLDSHNVRLAEAHEAIALAEQQPEQPRCEAGAGTATTTAGERG